MTPSASTENGRQTYPANDNLPETFRGGGELGDLIRGFDWSTTVLGPISGWPESLKTAVRICLGSRYPIVMWWGRSDLVQFYNDGYIPVLGPFKHPSWLGRSGRYCWAEIWPTIGPMVESVFDTGEATWSEDLLLVLNRNLPREEGFFTFSYSPLPDDSGGVAGIFCAVTETTGKVVSERRLRSLRDLGATVMQVKTAEEACTVACETLSSNRADVPFAMIYLLDEEGREARLACAMGVKAGTAAAPEFINLLAADAAWPLQRVLETGAPELITGIEARFGDLPGGPWPESPDAALVLPVSTPGQTQATGFLIAGLSPRRIVDAAYRSFFDLVAGHVATAIANARAYEAERRRAEALMELDRAKTAFFSNVSHEFRTPLTLMLGPLENLLAAGGAIAPEYREEITTAHRNSLRLLKLVNSLLDFSRIEAGRLKASFAPVDLSSLTADLSSNFRSAMEAAGLELIVDCKPLPEPVYVDRDMWEKIVLNLLSNAFKFTFEGRVTVCLEPGSAGAVLTVSDTGTGIPESELPHIFERFHRVEGARGRTYEGTGIGLALIQELIKLHGGTVEASSRIGEGSIFTVRIPYGRVHLPKEHVMAAAAPAGSAVRADAYTGEALTWIARDRLIHAAEEEQEPVKAASPDSRPRILLADDNADMREHVARILGSAYEIVAVPDGRAALEAAAHARPDLVLADVMMPKLDGFGLLSALRADPRMWNVPFIMLSARAGEEARNEGMQAGADDYLVKPFSARELLTRIRAHLKLAKARHEASEQSARLLESITDGFIALDSEWRFSYVNAESERLIGMKREELLGKSYWELFPASVGTTLEREYRRVVRDRVPAEFGHYYAPWNRWFHIKAQPAGEGGISVFFRDITEHIQESYASLLLASIVDSSEDAIISKDLNGVITSWNKSAERLFGYTAEEATGKTVAELLIPLDRQDEETHILNRLRKGYRVEHFETIRRRKDGTTLHVSLTISPVRNAQGEIIGASKIARDISQQVKTRDAIEDLNFRLTRELAAMTRLQRLSARLAQANELNVLLEEVLDAAIDILRADMGNIQLFREERLRIACHRGFKQTFLDFFDSVEHGTAVCGTALQQGKRVMVEDVCESQIFAGKAALEVMLEAGARAVQSTPLVSRSGRVLGMLSTHYRLPHRPAERELRLLDLLARQAADLIESSLSAEALRESERQFRELAAVGPQIVWVSGPQGELQFVNQRWVEFSGLDYEATKDPERLGSRLHPEDHVLDHWRRSVETGTPFELEARLRGQDGEFRWFMMRSVPVSDEQSRIVRWFGTSTDIHQHKLLQLELKRANQDLEQFAYSASHDLQEPLRSVKIFSELLAGRYGDKLDGQALEFLGNVRDGAGRMEMLVRDLLAYTKASMMDKTTELVDANEALQAALANLAGAIKESGATIEHEGTLPEVRVHPVQLAQLFQNLIGNAIKYHKPGVAPMVRASVREENGSWVFSLTDNGIGIDPAYKETIFGLFKRLHTGDEYTGTGIGLALCQRIVERHHGRIWVESEPGKGATFHFSLPQ